MLGTPPPSGPSVDTLGRQQNQLLSKPGGTSGMPGQSTMGGGSSLFPQINSALSKSPLLQQSNSKIMSMVQALMGGQRGM
jgi:hypothetical protein